MKSLRTYLHDESGVALTIVIVVLISLAFLSAYSANSAYNQMVIMNNVSGEKVKAYFCAQAGAVNAQFRIRADYTAGLVPAGTFTNPAYDPGPYNLDVDGDTVTDTTVDIGPVNGQGMRPISSTGMDL